MFDPISARLASSCSKKGISAVDTLTSWMGATSMYSTSSGSAMTTSSPSRVSTRSSANCPSASNSAWAWAMRAVSSASAARYTMSSSFGETYGRTAMGRSLSLLICPSLPLARVGLPPALRIVEPLSSRTSSVISRPARLGSELEISVSTLR